MRKIVDINSVARPINLNNREEKLDKRRKEILETQNYLKKRAQEILRRN
ncbi:MULTISPECIES: hypothetical protein [Bacillota]